MQLEDFALSANPAMAAMAWQAPLVCCTVQYAREVHALYRYQGRDSL
jgi:hypothetical protein